MKGYFNDKRNIYVLEEEKTKFPLHNYHFNRTYYMTVANDLSGESKGLEPFEKNYTRGSRYLFIQDGEKVWSIGEGKSEKFSCEYALHSTKLKAIKNDLAVTVEAFVPNEGMGEYFIYTIQNKAKLRKNFSLSAVVTFEEGIMGARCSSRKEGQLIVSEVTPYHVYYDDYEKIKNQCGISFSVSSRKPNKVCCSEYALFDGVKYNKEAVFNCANREISYAEKPVGAFFYDLSLEAGESISFWTFTGLCKTVEEAEEIAKEVLKCENTATQELLKSKERFENYTKKNYNASGDVNIDAFASYWQKKQVLAITETRRCVKGFSIRNSLQDAMGVAYVDENLALNYFRECIALQNKDGSVPQHGVWGNVYPKRGLGLLYMRDGPAWYVICLCLYLNDSKNYEFLKERISYADGGEATVFEHILNAVEFMWKDRGMYGLSLLGDGDWTDPINGPGRKGKGVSTWTSMAYVFGMRAFLTVLRNTEMDNSKISVIEERISAMEENILSACFKDNQFIAGYNDDGVPYGCKQDKEGNLFLNMHSWAIISGVAKGEIKNRCVEIIQELCTTIGVLVMKPPFTDWNGKFGRISIKREGTTENGSAYCHASLFAAYALYLANERDIAENIIKNVLPTHNQTADFETQVPIFIPNYYFGLKESPQFGRSSAENRTGSSAWFLKIYNDFYYKI